MLRSPNVQVSYVIIYDLNISAFTIPIIINIKDESIETIALINCRAKETFIYKKLVK